MSFVAKHSIKNSITSSPDGLKMMSSQPETLSTKTIKYFSQLYAFWNGPAESSEIWPFCWLTTEIFPNSVWDFAHFKTYLFLASSAVLGIFTLSGCFLCHQTSDALRNMASLAAFRSTGLGNPRYRTKFFPPRRLQCWNNGRNLSFTRRMSFRILFSSTSQFART